MILSMDYSVDKDLIAGHNIKKVGKPYGFKLCPDDYQWSVKFAIGGYLYIIWMYIIIYTGRVARNTCWVIHGAALLLVLVELWKTIIRDYILQTFTMAITRYAIPKKFCHVLLTLLSLSSELRNYKTTIIDGYSL